MATKKKQTKNAQRDKKKDVASKAGDEKQLPKTKISKPKTENLRFSPVA
jgi:hypothetical protein